MFIMARALWLCLNRGLGFDQNLMFVYLQKDSKQCCDATKFDLPKTYNVYLIIPKQGLVVWVEITPDYN